MKRIANKIIAWTLLFSMVFAELTIDKVYAMENSDNSNIAAIITDDDLLFELEEEKIIENKSVKDEYYTMSKTIALDETLYELNSIDVNNIDLEYFEQLISVSKLETIGEWLIGLSYEDYDLLLSMNTSLNDQVYVLSDEGLVPDEADMLFYELAEISYWNTLTSTFSWNDRFQSGDKGDAKFRIDFFCDGERVGRYTVTASNVSQPSDGSTSTLSLSTISGSDWACSHGHDLNVKFSKIEAVTNSSNSWSGIRLFGQYTRPGHYIVTDGATNSGSSNYDGFWPSYFTRFGTNTYGTTGYSNKWCLDARYNSAPIVDEFALEGNMYVIGLYENSSINNYGYSTYFIDLQPVGMTYHIDPNGGYYNNSQSVTVYHERVIDKESEEIAVPVWNSPDAGKVFVGWEIGKRAVIKEGDKIVIPDEEYITTEPITLMYGSGEDGYYISKSLSNREYGTYLEWNDVGVSTLKAGWKTEWMTVYFNENPPSDSTPDDFEPKSKIVNYDEEYGELPSPTAYGYEFVGWFTEPYGGQQIIPETICKATESHTLYAHWQKALYTLTFDMNLPQESVSATITGMDSYKNNDVYQKEAWYNKVYGYIYNAGENNWPTPVVSGLTFDGWYTHPVFGAKINVNDIYTSLEDETVYAHWAGTIKLDTTTNNTYNPFTIGTDTFNKGGVDLEWESNTGGSGNYNVLKQNADGTYSTIKTNLTTFTYADTTATDNAAPNTIDESTIQKKMKEEGTVVSFDNPGDNGTKYTYYLNEQSILSASDFSTVTKNTSGSAQSFKSSYNGTYTITLYGAASNYDSDREQKYGAKVVGKLTMAAGDTIYIQNGGGFRDGAGGGYNGGGGGGGADEAQNGRGGGGATSITTSNRGVLSAYNSYKSEVVAVAGGSGGHGGVGYYYDDGDFYTSGGAGTSGASGADGGNGKTVGRGNTGIPSGGKGYKGTTSGGGAGGSSLAYADDSSKGGSYSNGGGGGGGGGYYGGGGASGGSSVKNDGSKVNHGESGGSGSFGQGGGGGDGYESISSSNWPDAGGGGGAGGGASYNGKLTSYTLTENSNNNTGYVTIAAASNLIGGVEATSNISSSTVTTDIKGYRYLVDASSNTVLSTSSGSFTTDSNITVPYNANDQYLHIAAQDGAGNISSTVHVLIPRQYSIIYNLDGGEMPEGTENPVSYNPSTPTFTLNPPEKEGYEFVGWTGTNGDDPELEVTIQQGTVGDLTYTANWMSTAINVDEISITGSNVYTNKPQEWYVKTGTQFTASFGSYTNDKLEYFAPNVNDLHIKNAANQLIHSIRSILMMETYSGTNGQVTVSNAELVDYISSTNERHSSSQEMTTSSILRMDTDKSKAYIYPQGHIITAGDDRLPDLLKNKTSSSLQFDDSKRAVVISDGTAPDIAIDIPGMFKEEADWEIVINEDSEGSGIKDTKIYVTNISKNTPTIELNTVVNLNKESTTVKETGEISERIVKEKYTTHVNIDDNPEALIGILEIHVVTTDNVGNKSEIIFPTLSGVAIEASVHTLLPDHSNTFKAGQRGYVDIELNGYIEYLTIDFEQEFEEYRTEEEGMECIPVFSNPDEQRDLRSGYEDIELPTTLSTTINLNETENGVLASARYKYYFDIPIYAEEKNGYKVNLYGININGDIIEAEAYFNVTESILDEFRTTIRNN